jgi:hypothetical protein
MNTSFSDGLNPADLRIIGTVQSVTVTVSNGIKSAPTWSTVEANVRTMELPPLRTMKGNEESEGMQPVFTRKRSFLYRKHSRTFTPKMRYLVGTDEYYITDIRTYMGKPHLMVMDCELRDNEN